MRAFSGLLAGFAGVCLAGAVLAENLGADDADALQLAMQKEGFLVTQDEAEDGAPILKSRVSDSTFRVYFYSCDEQSGCSSVQFSAGYDLDAPMSALQMNTWNTENRYSRAIIDDEGDPYLRMDISLATDGIGPGNFAELLDLWRLLVEDFEQFIDW